MKVKILHLTLSKKPFEVMVTGEEFHEYRKPSNWIQSRLFNKDFSEKEYTHVKFVNGYGADKPYFIAEYKGFGFSGHGGKKTFSNGFVLELKEGDIIIFLGAITEKGNLNPIPVTNKTKEK